MQLEELRRTKVVISCAMTGTSTPRAKNPHLPVTPEEIAEDALAAWRAGAAVVHLHMRDDAMNGIMDWERFEKTVRLIRSHKECDVIINCTSSGGPGPDGVRSTASRLEHFKRIPQIEVGSFDAGTFNWGDAKEFNNDPVFLKELAHTYLEHGVKPEVEIFDMGMLGNARHYFEKLKLLQEPLWCQFVLGVLGGMEATPENLQYLVRHLPEGALWSATGIGSGHLPILYSAIALGANGVRVGLEDNLYLDRGVPATNAALVERAAQLVRLYNKQPATPAEARQIMGIPPLER
ncbi:3-keto-5-aminohexanoate cleavage protein [Lawsonibacter celer]|jgi:3-keto-5-aminohexanoate cleavage enzyme|uniref:3-keto-5-aminohexanoate cleavage protein n=1 Tax=Lawsonibacter celer TaxID=2986526 RepID=UPI0016495D06|nr:3-keto-5-aminohexanoate cleavage protein [Lawsonibacter celer]